jgi:hypothetical protein
MQKFVRRSTLRPNQFSFSHSLGQLPPPNHVRVGGSFRRKRPWYPHRHEHTTTIPSRRPDDPRQHARQRRAVARRVMLAVPPPCDLERGPVARSCVSASIWATHGVHALRHHWCRRPAELAGTATAREPDRGAMAMTPRSHGLAGSPHGCTEAALRAHGFTVGAACQDRAHRTCRREAGDREGGRPDAQYATADDH